MKNIEFYIIILKAKLHIFLYFCFNHLYFINEFLYELIIIEFINLFFL